MKYILAGLFFIGSIFLSSVSTYDIGFAIIVIGTILGFVLGKVFEVQKDLNNLRETLSKDWEVQHSENQADSPTKEKTPSSETTSENWKEPLANKEPTLSKTASANKKHSASEEQPEYLAAVNQAAKSVSSKASIDTPQNKAALSESRSSESSISNQQSYQYQPSAYDSIFDKAGAYIKDYFTGGNLFVRIGIIILFFGVSFLLKYVSDRGFFPIEYRLIAVVIGAMGLLGLGWRLRLKNETYALLLQGAGIGILYLDIYAAFSLYQFLAPTAAFALLFIVSMLSAALAVMQDSKSLAVLGFSGGFLAPILASTGSNNHVALFSYYIILNLAIVAVAWFKAWRPLNLLGFAFTFIIGTVWGVLSYNNDKFTSTEPFLILFFLFYVLIAVLFALRQPPKLRGYVDGTLLFGVPLAASALQYSLVKDFEYGVSLSSFAMGAFYLLLSSFIWKRKGDGLKLLAEAFLALGVIFASMAIPFALAPTQTAAAWALEGAGLLWLGSRQNRLSVRVFGLILQAGAGLIFIARFNYVADLKPFLNGEFISSIMMAIAGIFSARLLIKPFKGRQHWEESSSPLLLGWGLLWLFGGFVYQMLAYYPDHWLPSNLLLFTAIVSAVFTLLALRLKPEWQHAWMVASGLFMLILLLALGQLASRSNPIDYHPLQYNGWLAWPIVLGVYYYLLKNLEQHKVLERFQPIFHGLLLILVVALVTLEGHWLLRKQLSGSSDWLAIWAVIPATIALWMTIKATFWPFSQHQQIYRQKTGLALVAYMGLWSFIALISAGKSDPLPWLPLLNPLDIMILIVFISLFKWWKIIADNFALMKNQTEQNKVFNHQAFAISLAGLGFLWLNFTLFRIAHHWFGIPFNPDALYNSNLVQTATSILWALSGVILTVYASRKQVRFLWVTGAALLGLVVFKLFVIDLSALGSLARVISFLVVGALLTSIGYFSPIPDKDDATIDANNEGKSE